MKDSRKTFIPEDATITEAYPDKSADNSNLEPYLVILSGQDQGKQYRLRRQYNTFGRAFEVDIMINDSKISRKHGVFIIYPDHIILEDLQSTNGCYVNNIRVEQRQVIGLTTRIQIGNTLMKIEYKKASEVKSEKAIYIAANTDDLTKLLNRRAFMTRANEEFLLCKQNNGVIAIIMCDIDYFKQINDNFGHPAGDKILIDLAKILQMRKQDIVARFGGEEFIMLMRNTNIDIASKLAERIRRTIDQFNFEFQGEIIPVTISIGICCQNGKSLTSLNKAIKKADDALYLAKKNGRNRIELA